MTTKKAVLNIGHVVQLKTGGPKMTIEAGGLDSKGQLIFRTVWFADATLHRGKFLASSLVHA